MHDISESKKCHFSYFFKTGIIWNVIRNENAYILMLLFLLASFSGLEDNKNFT